MNKMVILCVDDENTIIRSLKEELMNLFGYKCAIEIAESGEEALEIFFELLNENREVPVVISDYIMPDMKGDELLKRVHQISPGTLNIMLTGQAVTEGVINAVNNANLFRYIEKPWEKEELRQAVCEAIECYSRGKMIEDEGMKLVNTMEYLEEKIQEKIVELEDLREKLGTTEGLSATGKLAENVALFKEISGFLDEIKTNISFLEKLGNESSIGDIHSIEAYLEKEKFLYKANKEKIEKLVNNVFTLEC